MTGLAVRAARAALVVLILVGQAEGGVTHLVHSDLCTRARRLREDGDLCLLVPRTAILRAVDHHEGHSRGPAQLRCSHRNRGSKVANEQTADLTIAAEFRAE